METPPKERSDQQFCQIRIMFPTTTDEQAIEVKKKISVVMAEIPDAHITFSLMGMPPKAKNGSPIQ